MPSWHYKKCFMKWTFSMFKSWNNFLKTQQRKAQTNKSEQCLLKFLIFIKLENAQELRHWASCKNQSCEQIQWTGGIHQSKSYDKFVQVWESGKTNKQISENISWILRQAHENVLAWGLMFCSLCDFLTYLQIPMWTNYTANMIFQVQVEFR